MDVKFSIITPTYNCPDIHRNIASVRQQTYRNFEHIIVDDASDKWIPPEATIIHRRNQQRAISRNDGMKAARGEWVVWLDADDYMLPYYLEVLDQATKKYPNTKVFNYGGIVVWNNWSSTIRMSKKHYKGQMFVSGDIMSGGFAFKRECLEKTGYLPVATDPYTFAANFEIEHPEVANLYGDRTLGNPWGDDFAMFYMLTRYYEPQFLNIAPYVVMIRGEKKI